MEGSPLKTALEDAVKNSGGRKKAGTQKTPCDDTSSHGAFRFPFNWHKSIFFSYFFMVHCRCDSSLLCFMFIMFKEIVNGKIILDEGNNGSYKIVPHQNHVV